MKLEEYYNGLSRKQKGEWLRRSSSCLGKSKVTIQAYIQGTRRIQATDVEALTLCCDGQVTAHSLRPDIFPKQEDETEKETSA